MTSIPVKHNPEKAKTLLIHADYHIKDEKYDEALKLLNEVIFGGLDPTNLKAYFMAAEIFLIPSVLEPEKAIEVLEQIKPEPDLTDFHNLSPQDIRILFLKAKAYLAKPERADWEKCRKLVKIILEIEHHNLEAVELEADLHFKLGEYEKAVEIYNALFAQNYLPEQMIMSMAMTHYEMNEIAWAYSYVKELYNIYQKPDPMLDELSKKVNKSLYLEVIKPDQSLSWLNKFLMKNLPFLAMEKIAAHVQNIVDKKKLYAKLYYDNLSGLWNDLGFQSKIPEFFQQSKKRFFLCSIDVNYFRAVNNCLGHDMGDRVVMAIGRLLQQNFPQNAYRLSKGGDEFYWTIDSTEEEAIQKAVSFRKLAEKAIKEIVLSLLKEKPLRDLSNKLLTLPWNVSITQGLAEWTKGITLDELKMAADQNSEESKKTAGRNSVIYKLKLVEKGEDPINYSTDLLTFLEDQSKAAGFPDWWKYKDTLKPEEIKKLVKQGESLEPGPKVKVESSPK